MSDDENKLIAERRAKLDKLRTVPPAFPNDFRRDALADQLLTAYGDRPTEWFDKNAVVERRCFNGGMATEGTGRQGR